MASSEDGEGVKLEYTAEEMKLIREMAELKFQAKKIELEIEQLNVAAIGSKIAPRQQRALLGPSGSQHMIVLGGRRQDGQSLKSVERYIFREGRWIELPPMNTPRSFASSVLVDNQIVVSGGDTGDTITDSIEILNLDETPLQWVTSAAKLFVPLSAHQTVVYQGKLIVIGGCVGGSVTNSPAIFEVLLTPPYMFHLLCLLPQPRAWHGAELVNDKIFIFGGGSSPINPTNDVFVYDPSTNLCSEIPPLPYRVQGMATVRWGNNIFLLGGVDEREEELDHIITYDTESGETEPFPPMMQRRGGCCAVIRLTGNTSSDSLSDILTNTLVVLGSLRQLKTVETYDSGSHLWRVMPCTREARELCTAVFCPLETELKYRYMHSIIS